MTTLREQQELAAARFAERAAARAATEQRQRRTGTRIVDTPEQIRARAERLLGDAVGARAVRRAAAGEGLLERIIEDNDLQPRLFLGRGTATAETVCRVSLPDGAGTGFLVGRRLLLTNNHVLPDVATAAAAFVEFDFELGDDGRPEAPVSFDLDPATLFLTDEEVDATIVAVAPANGVVAGDTYGWNRLLARQGKIVIGEAANVIGHPSGRRKEIALRNNRLLDQLELFLHYEADTEPGNSGSPVFNDQWEVVALHHAGVPSTDADGNLLTADGAVWDASMGEDAIAWVANEGARMSVVLARLRDLAQAAGATALFDELGAEALIGTGAAPPSRVAAPASPRRENVGRRGLRAVPETAPHVVFLHGRAQEGKDPLDLRSIWSGGLARGLGLVRLPPIDPARIWFPYYGDRLAELAGPAAVEAAPVGPVTAAERGAPVGSSARATYAALIEDAAGLAGFRPDLREGFGDLLAGVQPALTWIANKSWLDDLFIATVFHDVAVYLDDERVRTEVLDTVLEAFPTSGTVTLVAHSLGTVVALDLLTRAPSGVEVELLVTAGSPLGLDAVNKQLLAGGPRRPDVGRWVNAWCPADAVAIGCPLAPVWGRVEDVQTVASRTDSAHSIVEYLADLRVASAIGDTV